MGKGSDLSWDSSSSIRNSVTRELSNSLSRSVCALDFSIHLYSPTSNSKTFRLVASYQLVAHVRDELLLLLGVANHRVNGPLGKEHH